MKLSLSSFGEQVAYRYVAAYLVAIVAANLLTNQFGPDVSVINAFLFIGLDLTARDGLHDLWRHQNLKRNMALLIAVGSLLTIAFNTSAWRIALASFSAFSSAAIVDTLTYHRLYHRTRLVRVNGSNLFSAFVDSIVFPALAFGFPLRYDIMALQFGAKVLGGFLWSLVLMRGEIKKGEWWE